MVEVSAKNPTTGKTVKMDYDFGANVKEMVEKFGELAVFDNAKASLVVSLQGILRSGLKSDKSNNEIIANAKKWVPGVKRRGKSPQEKLAEEFKKMDPEERKELLKKLSTSK